MDWCLTSCLQFQDLEGIAFVSLAGTVGQLTAVLVVLGKWRVSTADALASHLPAQVSVASIRQVSLRV